MKRLFYLINFEMRGIVRWLLILCGAMVAFEILSFSVVAFKDNNQYLRFEELLNLSGYHIIYFTFLGVLLVLVAFTFYRNNFGSKSIYTLMTLPSKRSYIFISKHISAVACALTLTAAQIGVVFLTYGLRPSLSSEIPDVNNELFLAFARSEFLRIIFPFDLFSIIVSFTCLISLISMALFAVICERSRNFGRLLTVPLLVLGTFIFTFPLYRNETSETVKALIFTVLCTSYMISYSIKAVEHTKIL